MDKISHIIPTSTRQIWISGEIDKPRRVSEPTVEDRVKEKLSSLNRRDLEPESKDPAKMSGDRLALPEKEYQPLKGSRLDTTA